MSQPPFPRPDEKFPVTGTSGGSYPTQPAVPSTPPAPRVTPQTAPQNFPATNTQPQWGGSAPSAPSWNQSTQQANPGGGFPAPYAQQQYPQYGQQFGAPQPAGSPAMGVFALIFGLIATIASAALVIAFGGPAVRRFAEYQDQYGQIDGLNLSDVDLSFFSPARDSVMWLEVSVWVGTIAGIIAIILGIVAIAQRKGRGLGIFALILGIIGPIVWAAAVVIAGMMAGVNFA